LVYFIVTTLTVVKAFEGVDTIFALGELSAVRRFEINFRVVLCFLHYSKLEPKTPSIEIHT
jgi:hypothetical protein